MDRRTQKLARPASAPRPGPGAKKNSARLLDSFLELWQSCPPVHFQSRVQQRAQALALSSLLCLGRRTVTGLLSTCGQQFQDWSAAYRLSSQHRIAAPALFTGVRQQVAQLVPDSEPICIAVDDSLFPRSGAKIHGVGWRRDPLGPKFQTNFIRAQRFLQFAAAVPVSPPSESRRMIPIDFLHCPTPCKPGKKATHEERQQYRQQCRAQSLTTQASTRLAALCANLPRNSQGQPRPRASAR